MQILFDNFLVGWVESDETVGEDIGVMEFCVQDQWLADEGAQVAAPPGHWQVELIAEERGAIVQGKPGKGLIVLGRTQFAAHVAEGRG